MQLLFHTPKHKDQLPTMLYIIGLGLADEKDISVKGLEIVRKASRVYLEAYTAILLVEKDQLVRPARYAHQRFLATD